MYKRPDMYRDGRIIPIVLPYSYQLSTNTDVPQGQQCLNCKAYDTTTGRCSKWYGAYVAQVWWCSGYQPK